MTAAALLRPIRLNSLVDTAQALLAGNKGLLAIDGSTPTCNQRFARPGITQDEPTRRAYRELILTTPGLGDYISGVSRARGDAAQPHNGPAGADCPTQDPVERLPPR